MTVTERHFNNFFASVALVLIMFPLPVMASFAESDKEKPTTYKLGLVYVFEDRPAGQPEYILTVGQSGFKSVDALKQAIANFPEGSILEWAPSCKVMGGAPLSTEKELDDLKKVCEKEKIKFVHIPSG